VKSDVGRKPTIKTDSLMDIFPSERNAFLGQDHLFHVPKPTDPVYQKLSEKIGFSMKPKAIYMFVKRHPNEVKKVCGFLGDKYVIHEF
jgi:hypothetical protein